MGKPAIIAVLGYSMILMVVGLNLQNIGTRSAENYFEYYERSVAHNIALCGANFAANQIFVNPTWRTGYPETPFSGGFFEVTVDSLAGDTIRVTSEGVYRDYSRTVTILLQRSSFAKFSYYSDSEKMKVGSKTYRIWWTSKDTVWGPMHTNDELSIYGLPTSPVFYGKVSSKKGLYKGSKGKGKFYGGYQSGVDMELPSDMSKLQAAAAGGRKFSGGDVELRFNADGTVTWEDHATGNSGTDPLNTFAPNGAILVENGNMRIQGSVNGKVTVAAVGGTGSDTAGNVFIDDDIVYAQDPRTGLSDDVLGIAVENDVIITENVENNSDVVIQATIFSRTGSFRAENYDTRPVSGKIELYGGVTQKSRGPVGTFSATTGIKTGFSKRYRYDERFLVTAPPFFPTTGKYEILSWLE